MVAVQNLLPAPELGQLYVSFDALKDNIEDWSVREKFHFIILTKDVSRVIYISQNNAWDWRLRANKQDDDTIKISVLHAEHTCIALLTPGLLQHTSYQHWLQRHIPRYLHITRATHVQDIIDCAPLQFGEVISNQVAKKLKTCSLEDEIQSCRINVQTILI